MTAFYGGVDLHSNNSVVVVIDDSGKVLYRRLLVNECRAAKRRSPRAGRG